MVMKIDRFDLYGYYEGKGCPLPLRGVQSRYYDTAMISH
ncbi:protein of unknown function [Magnetospirillum sp. XM-1]|nr:protein of unknown function [Magnetospirillum sp. XM-1]